MFIEIGGQLVNTSLIELILPYGEDHIRAYWSGGDSMATLHEPYEAVKVKLAAAGMYSSMGAFQEKYNNTLDNKDIGIVRNLDGESMDEYLEDSDSVVSDNAKTTKE